MKTEIDHLLVCLIEECAEIQKHATKALRDPTILGSATERKLIMYKWNDLQAVVAMLQQRRALPVMVDHEQQRKQRDKVLHFMDYARERGELE